MRLNVLAIFNEVWWLTSENPWSSQSFPSDKTAGVSSGSLTVTKKSYSLTYTVASSFDCTSPLAVAIVVGFWETFTVSNSAEFKSFRLNTCIGAPVSTKNSRSFGFVSDGAGSLWRYNWSVYTHLRRRIALVTPSLLEIYPQMLVLAWLSVALVNVTRLLGLKTFAPFRNIDEDIGGSTSCNTQTTSRVFYSMESVHQFSSRPGRNSTADVFSLILRAALSASPFVSERCGVNVHWFHERSSHALPNSRELSV